MMKKYILPLILILILTFASIGYCGFWLSGYDHRIKLTVDHSKIDADLSHFPVTVFFTDSQAEEIFTEFDADSDYMKCAFTTSDGMTELYAEKELFDYSASKAIYYVSRDGWSISHTADTDFYYYGNDHANNTKYIGNIGSTAGENVWDTNFKMVQHMKSFGSIPETNNPILTATEAWEGPGVIETSIIMDSSQCDMWYRANTGGNEQIGYASATDSKCAVWNKYVGNPLTDIPTGSLLPYVLEDNGTYYMFIMKIGRNIYLYKSTNKLDWTVMNSGNAVLTHSDTGTDWYYEIFNVGVAIVGNTWHMLIEGKASGEQFKMGYSYSTLEDLDWNTHISANIIIDNSGNPDLIYVPDKNVLLSLHGLLPGGAGPWEIVASCASLSDDLALEASWHLCPNFRISESDIHITDPHLAIVREGSGKDYNMIISYTYNQGEIYQAYSDLALNEFYEAIILDDVFDSTNNNSDATKKAANERMK